MELKGKRVILLVEEMFNEYELIYPYYRLQEAGAEVVRVGPKAKLVYRSKLGLPTKSDMGMDQVEATEFDGIVIPGGYAPDHMRRHQKMWSWFATWMSRASWWPPSATRAGCWPRPAWPRAAGSPRFSASRMT